MGEIKELAGLVTDLANTVKILADHQKQQADAKPEPKPEPKPESKPEAEPALKPDNSRDKPLTAAGKKMLDGWVNSDIFRSDIKHKKAALNEHMRKTTGRTN